MRTDRVLKIFLALIVLIIVIIIVKYKCQYGTDTSIVKQHKPTQSSRQKSRNTLQRYVTIDTYLFVLILSAPDAIERRNTLRETWLAHNLVAGKFVTRRFVVGTSSLDSEISLDLQDENEKYKDLLLLDNLVDSYTELTKKLLQSLLWIYKNVNAQFIFKADDDTFVRLDAFIEDMKLKENIARLYWGFFRGDAKVKKRGPWRENAWVLCDTYLPYALGGGYLISSDLLEYITLIAPYLHLYNSEDVSFGTWLSPIALNRIHDVRFDTEYKTKGCHNKFIVMHKQTKEMMYAKQKELENNWRLCEKDNQTILSYDYNWKVPPSECCKRVQGIP